MSKKTKAYTESKLFRYPVNNRQAFYAGWDAAMKTVTGCAECGCKASDGWALYCVKCYEQAEKQEPVAWSVLDKRTGKHWYTHESRYTSQHYANEYSHRETDGSPSMVVTPLYTAAQQRKWVGLLDMEIIERSNKANSPDDFMDGAVWAEERLKEKNNV